MTEVEESVVAKENAFITYAESFIHDICKLWRQRKYCEASNTLELAAGIEDCLYKKAYTTFNITNQLNNIAIWKKKELLSWYKEQSEIILRNLRESEGIEYDWRKLFEESVKYPVKAVAILSSLNFVGRIREKKSVSMKPEPKPPALSSSMSGATSTGRRKHSSASVNDNTTDVRIPKKSRVQSATNSSKIVSQVVQAPPISAAAHVDAMNVEDDFGFLNNDDEVNLVSFSLFDSESLKIDKTLTAATSIANTNDEGDGVLDADWVQAQEQLKKLAVRRDYTSGQSSTFSVLKAASSLPVDTSISTFDEPVESYTDEEMLKREREKERLKRAQLQPVLDLGKERREASEMFDFDELFS